MSNEDDLWLRSTDPEPGLGAVVVDADGVAWERTPNYGTRYGWSTVTTAVDRDPRSWVRLAGNHGPVLLVRPASEGAQVSDQEELELLRGLVAKTFRAVPMGQGTLNGMFYLLADGSAYGDNGDPRAVLDGDVALTADEFAYLSALDAETTW